MTAMVEKIPGGFRIDGLDLRSGKCGCTSVSKCCYLWSKIKKRSEGEYEFIAKMTTADSSDHYSWGYTVKKDGITVMVKVDDARDKDVSSAFIPPSAGKWAEKGWDVVEKENDREDGAVWRCAMCKWLYKENLETLPFEELPDDWKCSVCKAPKSAFEKIE